MASVAVLPSSPSSHPSAASSRPVQPSTSAGAWRADELVGKASPMKAALATAAATPLLLILLVGGATSDDVSAAAATGESSTPYPTDLPPAARPYVGPSTGCALPDPTGTGGCVTGATAWMLNEVDTRFGDLPVSCWSAHAWNPTSDHPRGKGCDYTFGTLGRFPGPADADRGWLLAEWLRANAEPLHVRNVIWYGRIWSVRQADEGWRAYTGGGVYDPDDPTGGHYDHVHISLEK